MTGFHKKEKRFSETLCVHDLSTEAHNIPSEGIFEKQTESINKKNNLKVSSALVSGREVKQLFIHTLLLYSLDASNKLSLSEEEHLL